jgi:hypothetical protein
MMQKSPTKVAMNEISRLRPSILMLNGVLSDGIHINSQTTALPDRTVGTKDKVRIIETIAERIEKISQTLRENLPSISAITQERTGIPTMSKGVISISPFYHQAIKKKGELSLQA